MKIGKLHTYWIILRSILVTLRISCTLLFIDIFGKLTRRKVNKWLHKWCKQLFQLIKLTYTVFDPYNLELNQERTYIVMSNHASLYDIPLIILSLPGSIRMMAKRELFRVPLWGTAMKHCEFVPISRADGKKVTRDLKYAKKMLESGIVLWIAPEGTRSRSGKLNTFKKGGFLLARQAKAMVIPVGIRGAGKVLPPKTLNFNLGEHVEVHIGKPIDTTQYTPAQRDQLVEDVRAAIKEAADL
ncbi:MAG: lysophospholipid acyltransferase family protein [Gammaproteobacteria bacterium]